LSVRTIVLNNQQCSWNETRSEDRCLAADRIENLDSLLSAQVAADIVLKAIRLYLVEACPDKIVPNIILQGAQRKRF